MSDVTSVPAPSDTRLRVPSRGRPSFTAFFECRSEGLVKMAALLVGSWEGAEDVVQEVLLQVHGRWTRFDTEDAALAYARTSVVNRSRSTWRRLGVAARKAPLLATERLRAEDPSPEAAVVLEEQRREVLAAVSGLPRRQREVLVLRYWLDLSEAQIAEVLEVHPGTVKSAASRGLASLSQALGEKA